MATVVDNWLSFCFFCHIFLGIPNISFVCTCHPNYCDWQSNQISAIINGCDVDNPGNHLIQWLMNYEAILSDFTPSYIIKPNSCNIYVLKYIWLPPVAGVLGPLLQRWLYQNTCGPYHAISHGIMGHTVANIPLYRATLSTSQPLDDPPHFCLS